MLSVERLLVELALGGRLEGEELQRLLSSAGIGERATVLVFEPPDVQAGAEVLDRCLAEIGVHALTGVYEDLLCAIVEDVDALPLAERLRATLGRRLGETRAAVSRTLQSGMVRQGFAEARSALEAVRSANGQAPEVASYENLGALELLLAALPEETLESYCRSVLGRVEGEERSYGEELLRSLDVFVEHNGHWERAAQALYCHRHTLRYRVRRIEALTERDFSRARDRIELWLALRGRELLR